MNLSLPLFDLPPPPPPPRPGPAVLLPEPPSPGVPATAGAPVQARQARLWPAEADEPARTGTAPGPALGTALGAAGGVVGCPVPGAGPGLAATAFAGARPGAADADSADTDIDTDTDTDTDAATHNPVAASLALHPGLWRASALGSGAQRCTATGFAALDAQLPGGGWPHGVLTELLLPQPGIGELRLLAPALAAVTAGESAPGRAPGDDGRCVMLFDPPAALSAWALAQQGQDHRHWLVVQARAGRGVAGARAPRTPSGLAPLLPNADLLWALEQALRSGHVGAVLAWLPSTLRPDALRRLQLAAQQQDGPVFLFREAQARSRPSAAPLRLLLSPTGVDSLQLRLLKRRGPPLAEPLRVQLPPVLTPQQQAQAVTRQAVQQAGLAAARTAALAGGGGGGGAGHGPGAAGHPARRPPGAAEADRADRAGPAGLAGPGTDALAEAALAAADLGAWAIARAAAQRPR